MRIALNEVDLGTVVILNYRFLIVSAGDLSAAILVPGAIRKRKETFVRIESGNMRVIDISAAQTEVFLIKKMLIGPESLVTLANS